MSLRSLISRKSALDEKSDGAETPSGSRYPCKECLQSTEQTQVLLGLLNEIQRAHAQGEDLTDLMCRARVLTGEIHPGSPSTPAGEEGYMCGMDFDCELAERRGGVPVYSSVEDLAASRSCIKHCGVARVRVVLLEWLQRPDFSDLFRNGARTRVALGDSGSARQKE